MIGEEATELGGNCDSVINYKLILQFSRIVGFTASPSKEQSKNRVFQR